MFTTRKEVDEHVHKMFSKVPSGLERDMKGLAVGRMYSKIQEYAKAIEYLNAYLRVKDEAGAHKLIARCYQQLKTPDPQKSLEHYQRSIQLNPKQIDVIKESCKLLIENKGLCNPEKASYWLELASAVEDLHDSEMLLALRMRSKLSQSEGEDQQNTMEMLIQKELLNRPNDMVLRVRLLYNYLENKRIDEAFNYGYKVELETPYQCKSIDWYDVVWTILQKYEQTKDTSKDWAYWQLLFITFDRQLQINLQSEANNSLGECIAQLFKFDQYLYKFSQLGDQLLLNGGRQLHQTCLDHYAGQLLLHAVSALFKRELVGNKNKWFQTLRSSLPLLLLGYQKNQINSKSSNWQRHCNDVQQQLLQLWRYQNAFRCAQLGRTLYGCLQSSRKENDKENWESNHIQELWSDKNELLLTARQLCVDNQWRCQIFQQLFTHPEYKLKEQSSYFVREQHFQQPLYEWPSLAEIEEHEQVALQLAPPTLEHHLYLALGAENLAEVPRVHFYKALRYDNKLVLNNCGVDTLSQLDVDIFLYAVVLQAQRKLQVQRENFNSHHVGNRNANIRPYMLPFANIIGNNDLITTEQNNWWTVMQRINDNINFGANYRAEQRELIQFGLQVVRCQNEPHMEIIMVLQLGKLLASREDCANLDARIASFYKLGINMMLRQQEKKLEPFYRYFKFANANESSIWIQIHKMADEALGYLSRRSINTGTQQDFLKEIHGLQLPMATYLQAEVYRSLGGLDQTSRIAKQNFQERRMECLRETMALLSNNTDHPLNSVVQRELKDVLLTDEHFSSPEFHNNSSTYEDAEDNFYSGAAQSLNRSYNRPKRQFESPATLQLEQTVKQMSKQLCTLKEDVSGGMEAVRQDIKLLTEKFNIIEELIKKCKISGGCNHDTQARDVDAAVAAAALGIDEFLNMEDAIQTNYINAVPSNVTGSDRFYSPAGNTAPNNAGYGSPMFNQNQMYNYFANQAQYRTPTAPGNLPPALYGPRGPASFGVPPNMYSNPTNVPFMDGFNYGIAPPPPSLIMPQVSQAPVLSQPTVAANVPLAPTAGFFNSAQYVPSPIQAPQQVSQSSQQPTSVLLPTLQQKTISSAITSTTISSGSVPPASAPSVSSINNSASAVDQVPPTPPVIFNRALNNQPVEKEPPANVVITSSDPLPKSAVSSAQPTLSVTIPPQHIKSGITQNIEPPTIGNSDLNFSSINNTTKNTNSNIFSGISSTFSFKPQVEQAAAEKQKELAADTVKNESFGTDPNGGLNLDTSAELDYDPRPDFQGIIPLPDEIEVRTGEEDEKVKFCHRAKLFRHIEQEWKERGIGNIKILTNVSTGSTRILMRREQTHKICANHKITTGMSLTTPEQDKEGKSFLWAANDFADEKLKLEKFLVRFKLPETAKQFKLAFDQAVQDTSLSKPDSFGGAKGSYVKNFVTSTPAPNVMAHLIEPINIGDAKPKTDTAVSKTLFGNLANNLSGTENASPFATFNFGQMTKGSNSNAINLSFGSGSGLANKSPTNMKDAGSFQFCTNVLNKADSTLQNQPQTTESKQEAQNKSTTSDADAEDEYVSTAQFAPVIPLPELIKVVTGEENELVLFEHRAKLLRFDKESNEWKERGLGNIKLLQLKTDPNQVRLVMRREQVLKLCCNQRLLPDTKFCHIKNSQNALTWAGQDYAEEKLSTELLCVRFKSATTCKEFYDAVLKAQSLMSQDSKPNHELQEKEMENKTEHVNSKMVGFGDAFKPKSGSWSCQGCYTLNDAVQLYCIACENPKNDSVPPKSTPLGQGSVLNLSSTSGNFSFGFAPPPVASCLNLGPKSPMETVPSFKDKTKSNLAVTFGDGFNSQLLEPETNVSKSIDTSKKKDEFALTDAANSKLLVNATKGNGFGDAFKLKAGSWNCNDCYTTNESCVLHCVACEAPKDKTVPKKNVEFSGGLNLAVPSKFTFGFGATPSAAIIPAISSTGDTKIIDNCDSTSEFKGFKSSVSSNHSNLVSNTFSFSMPTIQQQPKSPITGGADASHDDETHADEEENNAYFAPVIPLPDKIDVKTGEEDEDVLYTQRAKLYRLTEDGEWKERGLGNVKILRHKESNNLRVVMRREKVLKICLNHVLNNSVAYKPKDEKSWLFAVYDFSEGESVLERFALRFKNADIAQLFKNTVQCALNGTAEPICEEETLQLQEVITPNKTGCVSAKSEEIKKMAERLSLTYEFLTSETKCSGCRGCKPENFDYGHPANAKETIYHLPLTLPALKLPTVFKQEKSQTESGPSPNQTLLKASVLATNNSTIKCGSFGGFSNAVSANSTATTNLSSNNQENKSIGLGGGFVFGNAEKPVYGQNTSLFGGNTSLTKPQQSIFESATSFNKNLNNQTDSILGSTEKTKNQKEVQKSIFSGFGDFNTSNTSIKLSPGFIFGSNAGSSVTPTFGSQAMENKTFSFAESTNNKEIAKANKENIAGSGVKSCNTPSNIDQKAGICFSDLASKAGDDFASLAAKGASNPIGFQKSEPGVFFGLTHQDDFKNFKTSSKAATAEIQKEDKTENVNDDNYDPHYEPIIALPNEIVVSTGEENEVKLFGERATLFRYNFDTKEWKERGIGELKILKHSVLNTYRMVMRREQIFKLVLNMKIGESFTMEYMNEQKKSFIWANFNYAESPDGMVESLACRFKNQEIADQFHDTIKMCVKKAKESSVEEERNTRE